MGRFTKEQLARFEADGAKLCRKCETVKPLNSFPKHRKRSLGVGSRCKDCHNEQNRVLYHFHHKGQPRTFYQESFNKRLRREMLDAYGGRCACCGESEPKFLAIDHIHNDGASHRKEVGGGGSQLYAWLKRNNFPKDRFQLLCHNCNLAKGFYGECPHAQDNLIPFPVAC
jgi:hypothetical protein